MSALGGPVGLEFGPPGGWPASGQTAALTSEGTSFAVRRGTVRRAALLAELLAAESAVLVTLCAPAGFGKSTVLAQWAEVDARLFPWLSLTAAHDHRDRLLGDLALATASLRAAIGGLRLLSDVPPAVKAPSPTSVETIMGGITEPFVLVLDDAHLLTQGWRVIEELIASVPAGSLIAIASRRMLPFRINTHRLRGAVVEITERELAFDDEEAQVVLGSAVNRSMVSGIVDRCEGWPVGVDLTGVALSIRSGGQRSRRTSAEHDVLEYLRTEILEDLDDGTRAFLTRTAILGDLSGPLCDAVCDSSGSSLMLQGKLSDNLLVVPVPGSWQRYRGHRLLRRVLLADLRLREPDLIPQLHLRASRWFAAHGQLDAAVTHAKLSGDMTQLAKLIWPNVQHAIADGGVTRLRTWLSDLTDGQIGGSPDLIGAMAWLSLLDGRLDDAIRWQALGEAREGRDWRSKVGGSERRGVLALLRAWRGADGPHEMYADSSAAFNALPADSAWRAAAGAVSGIALAWSGRKQEAGSRLTASEELAAAVGNHAARADCLAALGCLAFEQGDQPRSQQMIRRARTLLLDHRLVDLPTSAFAVSVVALGLARAGRVADAAEMLERSLSLTTAMAGFMPWMQLQNHILQIDTCVLIGDIGTARRLARQAKDLLSRQGAERDFSPVLRAGLLRAESLLAVLPVDSMYGSLPLTPAEFRVLQLLPTHLSFPEMGELLFNSRHTVKTQALAVYRKLGVISRSAAVERARALGYLPPMMVPDLLVPIHHDGRIDTPRGSFSR